MSALFPPFESTFVDEVPGDPLRDNRTRTVHAAGYSLVEPSPVTDPKILAWSSHLAATLGISEHAACEPSVAQVLGGNALVEGMRPYAACYGGHQFGHWADQLGDGRAITLGEILDPSQQRWEIALKGAGPTPYSRRGDGRAVLRSSIREFVCSEAMFHLGVPTTRALALVSTGEQVVRDMFYDGRAAQEPGAIVTRVAPTFLRFGNFELPASRDDVATLRSLANYAIFRHFPHLWAEFESATPKLYQAWFREVAVRTAAMICEWMRVGFVHGVMNTDNMSILGLTIDYGPFGWLDYYDPQFTPNTTDAQNRRYRYAYQPKIAHWNLAKLASALVPLAEDIGALEDGLEAYRTAFESMYRATMFAKLGLQSSEGGENLAHDDQLLTSLLELLPQGEVDPTFFYRQLAQIVRIDGDQSDVTAFSTIAESFVTAIDVNSELGRAWLSWLSAYLERARRESAPALERAAAMDRTNPCLLPRNFLLQEAIDAATAGDLAPLSALLVAIRTPYEVNEHTRSFLRKLPAWARNRPGCSALSCSS
jgi:uncharacterized protein YdiU (UPF0061 family)